MAEPGEGTAPTLERSAQDATPSPATTLRPPPTSSPLATPATSSPPATAPTSPSPATPDTPIRGWNGLDRPTAPKRRFPTRKAGRGATATSTAKAERNERRLTIAILTTLMATSLVAHDLHRMLTQPLWRDEDWVALSLRAPFDKIVSLTATTPVLFTALLRVTPHWSPSSLRLLPLAFTVAAVVPAWYLGREIDRHSWLTRVALAAGVAFAPAMLARHDLKQYTAEAFDALVLLWLLARLEANWSRRNLVVLGAALGLSTLLSNGAMFLGPAVLICLAFVLILRRELHRLRDLAIVGAATLAFDFVVFVVIDRPADTPSLKAYWNAFYVPTSHGLANAIHFVHFRAGAELQSVGLGPSIVVGALILAGIVTLWRRGFPALALVVPVAAVEQLIAAGAHDYPLWDPRTSTWFTVMLTVYALIGLTGLARLARFAIGRWREGPNAAMAVKCTALFAVLVLVGLVVGLAAPYVHAARAAVDTATPPEDVHGQVQTIEAQHRPGDVIVSNVDAGFGLGIYWPAQPEFVFHEARLNTFRIAYPPADRIVVATTISTAAEIQAVRTAVAMAAATPHGRVWLVLSHWHKPERATMVSTLREYGTLTTPPDQHGMELVHLLTLRRPVPPTADAP